MTLAKLHAAGNGLATSRRTLEEAVAGWPLRQTDALLVPH